MSRQFNAHDTYFGNWLSDSMFDSDMTIEDVSQETGISKATIYRHVNAKSMPSMASVRKYADLMGYDSFYVYELFLKDHGGLLDPDALFEDEEDENA